jgi:putative membrane-bound dehydrogenase-like protein
MRSFPAHALFLSVLVVSLATPAFAQKVPAGFKSELIFGVPDIEHPSVVTCDDDGNLYVGEDPMDMRGPTKKEFDRVILIRWDKTTGKPIRTVFCENLAAVFGLVWHQGKLYVMHAPHYSVFEDTNGDGVSDVRKDLATGFGPPAGVYGFNDHIVTGTRLGLDRRVYVSVGDKGVPKATGSDGSTISLEGGGVIRMKLDGSELEVVTSGTRNHLDVAMDALDNIFTYDNTDDGLGWWTRFTHHIETGYYGYPYDYHPHPERHLPRISEHGGGSPVGADCYREAAWPADYQGNPFHCEWGKGKIQRFKLKKSGASFTSEIEDFMTKEGPEEFRPLDVCFSPDGKTMYVADWNFGGWVNPKVCGRLFRVTYEGKDAPAEPPRAKNSDPIEAQIKSLAHPSHAERMRAQWALALLGTKAAYAPVVQSLENPATPKFGKIHAIWTLNALTEHGDKRPNEGVDPVAAWLKALYDKDEDVRGQAARALGLRRAKMAVAELAKALKDPEAGVRLRAAVALGRIADPAAATALFTALAEGDVYARFAMIQAIRQVNNWQPAEENLKSANKDVRLATLVALTGAYDDAAVAVLVKHLQNAADPAERAMALDSLAYVNRKADPYTTGWWGTQPAKGKPSRAKKHDWTGTSTVMTALRESLGEGAPEPVRVAAIRAFRDIPDPQVVPQLAKLAGDAKTSDALRQEVVQTISAIGSPAAVEQLTMIAGADGASPELAVLALGALGKLKAQPAAAAVEKRLAEPQPKVRAAAVASFAQIKGAAGAIRLAETLKDQDVAVRQAALAALADLKSKETVPAMLAAAGDPAVRFEAQTALAAIPDKRALGLYLDGLTSKSQPLRKASHEALVTLRGEIGPDILELHKRNELPPAVRGSLQAVFSSPTPLRKWQVVGAFVKDGPDGRKNLPKFDPAAAPDLSAKYPSGDKQVGWRETTTNDPAGKVDGNSVFGGWSAFWGLAYTALNSEVDTESAIVLGSDDQITVWVNGKQVYDYQGDRGWAADQGRATVKLNKGVNHLWILSGNTGGGWAYSAAVSQRDPRFAFLFENVPAKLDPAVYATFATKNKGDAERGDKIFSNEKGVGCIKCHSVNGRGGKIGPDMAGVGLKYPREELIRSVLEPSNRILGEFHMTIVETSEGKVLQGLVKSDTPEGLELIDAEGKTHKIPVKEVESKTKSNLSLMPNGLKDGMTVEEFADIIAFLESLKQQPGGTAK